MRVFVYEYCCTQPLQGEATALALRLEGLAMLSAMMADLGKVPHVESVTLLADDFPPVSFPSERIKPSSEKRVFRRLAREADCTLVIAPEVAGILEDRCRRVLEAGGTLLGPSPQAVKLTADKYTLYQHLVARGLPTPVTELVADLGSRSPHSLLPGVCKPRSGAGSLFMQRVNSVADIGRLRNAHPGVDYMLQSLIRGTPASVAFLIGPRRCVSLRPARQILSVDGRFSYLGGWTPLAEPLGQRACKLAKAAVRSVPGLLGYVGVDVVLGTGEDGAGDRVIEINPRLTTSYIGLRELARSNLAGAMLDVVAGHPVRLSWHRRLVRWTRDSRVSALEA
jgi:predicted ATP-grasp superfamily ATP-dependent carboligase